MLKFGLDIHFVVIQNHTAVIFKILIFHDIIGGKIPKFSQNSENLNSDPLKNRNFKNSRSTILYHFTMYLQTKF